jgi:hypothetical protein
LRAQIVPYSGFDSVLHTPVPVGKQWIPTVEKQKYGFLGPQGTKILQKNDISILNRPAPLPSISGLQSAFRIDFPVAQMPFFCRQEYKYEKLTGIPLRFRVGSLQECDWLEQKPNALHP